MSYINGVLSGSISEIERYLEDEGFNGNRYTFSDAYFRATIFVNLGKKEINASVTGQRPTTIPLGSMFGSIGGTCFMADTEDFCYKEDTLVNFKKAYKEAIKWIEKMKISFYKD